MNHKLFKDELIRLINIESNLDVEIESKRSHDTKYLRMPGVEPSRPLSAAQDKNRYKSIEKKAEESTRLFNFTIRKREDNWLVGFIRIELMDWNYRTASLQLRIGNAADCGQACGTQVIKLMLGDGFTELNLQRVTLNAFEYNPRAVRSYEKAGFMVEGCERKALHRDRNYWDIIFMGVLREEWEYIDNLEARERFPGADQGAYNDHNKYFG